MATEFDKKIKKPHDEYMARIIRFLFCIPVAKLFLRYKNVTPNQITVISIFPGILSIIFLSLGGYTFMLIGAFFAFLHAVLDGSDGIVARAKDMQSKFGAWLDGVIGYVLLPLMMLAAGIGLRNYLALMIGSLAALCFPIQFSLIHFYKSEIKKDNQRIEVSKSGKFEFLKYIYGSAIFIPALLISAIFNKTIYVLLFFAVFGNLFWMVVIIMHYRDLRKEIKNFKSEFNKI